MYIYKQPDWPEFYWNKEKIFESLSHIKLSEGLLLGKMQALGFDVRVEADLTVLTKDILKSSEIEGEILNKDQVRSSIAKRLGLNIGGDIYIDRNVEGIVEMMLDATKNYDKPLTHERLISWQASLFPTGYSGLLKIETGQYRKDMTGPMQVVSGPIGKETVHYQAPPASSLDFEMSLFINWFNSSNNLDGVIKAGIAHLWFVMLHPFDDGNGRIARAITDMLLARAENCNQRFYSMSAQIRKERDDYYNILEKTQKGSLDITEWLIWFIDCLGRAIENTKEVLNNVFNKTMFWQMFSDQNLNERQKKVINKLLDEFEGKLTSSKWAKLCKCSQDSANRDILDLIEKNMLIKMGAGRSTSYVLNFNRGD